VKRGLVSGYTNPLQKNFELIALRVIVSEAKLRRNPIGAISATCKPKDRVGAAPLVMTLRGDLIQIRFENLRYGRDGFEHHSGAFKEIHDLFSAARLPAADGFAAFRIHVGPFHMQGLIFRRPAGVHDLRSRPLDLRLGQRRHGDEKFGHGDLR